MITAVRTAHSHFTGSRTSSAINTMHQPRHHITPAPIIMPGTNVHAKLITVSSRNTSHSPRVQKKREILPTVLPRPSARYAPVPARKQNVGAQKCVIHRV